MKFYLGTHEPTWLKRLEVPLFVSLRRLKRFARPPRSIGTWAMDSGGFTELSLYGQWRTNEDEYIDRVAYYQEHVGNLEWAAPMDWMCDPRTVENTGLSVLAHQELTVQNYLDLKESGLPFIPVLQGWGIDDYLHCISLYEDAGVDLADEPVVGVGSVVSRQYSDEVEEIMRVISQCGIRLHGFGVKVQGLRKYGQWLASSDSMAWSYQARREDPLPECTHKRCSNCARYALLWRQKILDIG